MNSIETLYPTRVDEISDWSELHRATSDEGRRRYVQFVVLQCLAESQTGRHLAFKGGNALRFCFGNPRSTLDLDFTAMDLMDDLESLRRLIDEPLRELSDSYKVRCKVQRAKRKPPGRPATRPTYEMGVGYQFEDGKFFATFWNDDVNVSTVVPIEVSLNDVVCRTTLMALLPESHLQVQVCTLEDILAEKLRAILQQRQRNRNRPQDIFDVAHNVRQYGDAIHVASVRQYFFEKCRARAIEPSLAMFDEDLRARSEIGYKNMQDDLGVLFIPFEVAWHETVEFTRRVFGSN